MAQKFDLKRLVTTGDPLVVERNVSIDAPRNAVDLTAGGEAIAYRATKIDQIEQLRWFDRKGKPLTSPGLGSFLFPRVAVLLARWPSAGFSGLWKRRHLYYMDSRSGPRHLHAIY
jgi:hypothetical protein